MQKHKEYWINMTAYLLDKHFKGDKQKYKDYLRKSFKKVEPIMEEYTARDNEFWLKNGDERAFYQALEPTLLVPVEVFEVEVSALLGREFDYFEICADDEVEREKKLTAFREEICEVFKTKHPDLYEEYLKQEQCKKENANAEMEEEDLDLELTLENNFD